MRRQHSAPTAMQNREELAVGHGSSNWQAYCDNHAPTHSFAFALSFRHLLQLAQAQAQIAESRARDRSRSSTPSAYRQNSASSSSSIILSGGRQQAAEIIGSIVQSHFFRKEPEFCAILDKGEHNAGRPVGCVCSS